MSDDPSIYDYTDFRAYLRDWFRARDGRPSQSGFARRVPCSAALLSSVINGTRNLGRARAERFANVLKHDAAERAYFLDLVWFAEAESPADRDASWRRISARRKWDDVAALDDATYRVFTNWLLPLLVEMARWPHFVADADWIASQIRPRVTAADVSEALDWLVEHGILDQDADDQLAAAVGNFGSDHDGVRAFQSHVMARHHQDALELMKQRLPTTDHTVRHYSTTTFSAGPKEVAELKRRIRSLVELTCAESEEQQQPDRVMMLSVQLAPLAGDPEVIELPSRGGNED